MRTRTVVIALAAFVLCQASPLLAQWTPRRIVTQPVQGRKVNAAGPVVRKPVTPTKSRTRSAVWRSGSWRHNEWRNYESDIGYKSYDAHTSDNSRIDRGGTIEW